uniref:Uncharacterized protein n=1 Tax=Arundo donax TaxID=35708 RepID=A0A0A8ZKW5_ARUDO
MVEEMYEEEMKDDPKEGGAGGDAKNPNPSSSGYASEGQRRHGGASGEDGGGGERKPTRAQLLVHDAGSLASVVGVGSSRDQQSLSFGMMDHLDFDAYNDGDQVAAARGQGLGGGGGTGVTLTLGLQQQHGDVPHAGVNVAFAAPAAAHEFLFMAGGEQQQMVAGDGTHGHHGQFGAGMEGDAASHYHRSLSATGFQLLHDLAG